MIYHNNLELKEIYTMRSKQVHKYHYICKLRIKLISQYLPVNTSISSRPGKYMSISAFLPTLLQRQKFVTGATLLQLDMGQCVIIIDLFSMELYTCEQE
jgi:hypothetical protein